MNNTFENARPFNVLFVCPDNAARSIMAESIMNGMYGNRFKAFSAGSSPNGYVDPYAAAALYKAGFSLDGLRSKSWNEFAQEGAPELDFVFFLSNDLAHEPCPQWPGRPATAFWDISDPEAVADTEVIRHLACADTFRMLCNRISSFGALPQKSLDQIAMQNRLGEQMAAPIAA
jgi:protein-tyrosine-phosphatase